MQNNLSLPKLVCSNKMKSNLSNKFHLNNNNPYFSSIKQNYQKMK